MKTKYAAKVPNELPQDQISFLHAVAEQISCAVIVTDLKFRIVFVNKAAERLYGYPASEMLGKTPEFLNAEPMAQRIEKDIARKVMAGKIWTGSHRNKRKDGTEFLCDLKISPLKVNNHASYFISVSHDITQQKNQEESLYASRQMLRLVLDNIPQRIFWKDLHSVYVGCNKTFAQDANLKSPDDIVGMNDYELPWTQEEADFYRECDNRVMKNDKPEVLIYESQMRADGREAYVETNKVPLHDVHGNVIGMIGMYADITERKQNEQAIRESEEKYRTLVESAGDAIFLADVETGYIIDANKKAEEMVGLPIDKIVGLHHSELHPKGESKFYRDIFHLHTDENPNFKAVGFVVNQKNNQKIPVQISGGLCELNGRKIIIGIFSDITEFKAVEDDLRRDKTGLEKKVDQAHEILDRTQKQLEDTKRLSELGTLAATVAHELRNPLGVIRTALFNIKNKVTSDVIDKHIKNIEKKIVESEHIIKNLLTYAQIKVPHYQKVSVVKVLNECLHQCRKKYAHYDVNVKVTKKQGRKNVCIEADPVHINELFNNILDNSFQSLKNKRGHINVVMDCDQKEDKCIFTFSDDGIGIERDQLPNIFDPFFSTKPRGTGLGLSVCNQLVNLYSGEINIQSRKGEGTTVTLRLPVKKKT